jgi:hypothetical protein
VKRESEALDVAKVEQLCLKFRDMPKITHRAIVSTSGFTEPARLKARHHGVELFTLKPWTTSLSENFPAFQGIGPPQEFVTGLESNLLCWVGWRFNLYVPTGPQRFNCDSTTVLYTAAESKHNRFPSFNDFANELLRRSTNILFALEPAETAVRTFPMHALPDRSEILAGPSWPHTHTIDVSRDGVFLKFDSKIVQIEAVTITGSLQWQRRNPTLDFRVLERSDSGAVFAGAAVADTGNGRMFAMIFSPDSRTTHIHQFELREKHKHMIRQLSIYSASEAR